MNGLIGQLLHWPLYSLRRLLTTIAVVAVIGVGLVMLASGGGEKPAAAPAPAAPGSRSPSASGSPAPSPSTSASPDYGQAIDIARDFVTAWASHPKDWREWYAGTAQYATDKLARQLTTVDMRNVPAHRVTGKLRLTDTGGVGQTQVAVPTDGGMVSVTLVPDTKAEWRVDELQPGAQTER
jgi:hypothetical protein